jgi:hypothetical protein
MGWVTIYITGKADFRDDVREKLENSDLNLMPGYNGGSGETQVVTDLYWVDEKITLREIKQAIGSKLVWKYRLQLFGSLEAFLESQNAGKNTMNLNAEEEALLAEMVASVYREAS